MFESHTVEDPKTGEIKGTGGNMASNYLAQILEKEGIAKPQWLTDIWAGKKSVDASKLTEDQQKMLFLAYHRGHPKSNFSEYISGDLDAANWWSKYHWAGKDDVQGHINKFNLNIAAQDSLRDLKAKEEELMYKQNMAPYLSDSNNINKLPKANDLLDSIFGTQDSSLIKEYDHGGRHFDFSKTADYSGET